MLILIFRNRILLTILAGLQICFQSRALWIGRAIRPCAAHFGTLCSVKPISYLSYWSPNLGRAAAFLDRKLNCKAIGISACWPV